MNLLTESQLRTFTREIMPALYRLQERKENSDKPSGGIYHLNDANDRKALMKIVSMPTDISLAS